MDKHELLRASKVVRKYIASFTSAFGGMDSEKIGCPYGPTLSRETIIFTTFCVDLGIAYKEIAESLCSRHNVVT